VPFNTNLTSASTIWAEIYFEGMTGVGRIAPVINIQLGVKTPTDGIEAEAHRLALTLTFEGERVSSTELGPIRIAPHGSTVVASFPISPRVLTFVGDRATGDMISFRIEIAGLLRVLRTAEGTGIVMPQVLAGEWTFLITDQKELMFSVPRGVWFSSVVSAVSDSSFVTVEIEVPKGTDTGPFAASFARLRDAERAYTNGDDHGVFSQCRGAIEALPGHPDHIVDRIENGRKRNSAEKLIKEAGAFLHAGRHVSLEVHDVGEFPVDHRDAFLALNVTRLAVAYVARI
jgi:hypothetical protein